MAITPEQRALFERWGVEIIRTDLATQGRNYVGGDIDTRSEDIQAAVEWVKEVDEKAAAEENRRYWQMLIITTVGAIAAVVAAAYAIREWMMN